MSERGSRVADCGGRVPQSRVDRGRVHNTRGRKVSGTCVAKTHGNAGKPACARVVADGSLRLRAGTGANQLRFEGRISPARKLKSGRYTVLFTATSRADKSSAPQSHSFTIAAP